MIDAAAFNDAVAGLLRHVASDVILPRFRRLGAADIEEKAPGELVTVADREAEAALSVGLTRLLPAARVVGEEACAADPARLDGLGDGPVWIVDPIDGTGNFAAGRAPFGIIVALVEDGVTRGAWILDPIADRLCHAAAGRGAGVDGRRIVAAPPSRRPIAALATQFMVPDARAALTARAAAAFDLVPIPRCAAEHYPRLALGANDVAVFQRTLPWDHAAGALFLTEAGGRVTRWDGRPYRYADDGHGILAAATPALWEQAAATLDLASLADARSLVPQALDPPSAARDGQAVAQAKL